MGTYADSLLTQGEVVLRRERQHWLSLFLETRLSILLWIIAIALLVMAFNLRDLARDGLSLGALAIIVIGLAFFVFRWWHWRTDEYVITNRRLLKVEGIINKRSGDSNLEKINDAILEENLIGRLLDYGDLEILTAAEVSVDRYRMLNHAKTFKKEMMTAKHALEDGRPYHDVATPPMRAPKPSRHHVPTPQPPSGPTRPRRSPSPCPVSRRCVTRGPSRPPNTRPRSRSCWAGCRACRHHGAQPGNAVRPARGGHHAPRRLPGPRVLPRLRRLSAG